VTEPSWQDDISDLGTVLEAAQGPCLCSHPECPSCDAAKRLTRLTQHIQRLEHCFEGECGSKPEYVQEEDE
jgi:hypothetical protein